MTRDARERGRRIAVVGGGVSNASGISQHTERLLGGFESAGFAIEHHGWRDAGPRRFTRAREAPARLDRSGLVWWNPFTWARVGLRARRADLVGLVWFTPLQAPALAVVGWITGRRRTFAIVHNGRPHEPVPASGLLTRLALRRCGLLVAHVDAVVRDLRQVRVRVPAIVVPLPPQIDVKVTPLPEGSMRLLHLGEVHRRYKGTDVLLDALRELRAGGVEVSLTIAGRCRGEIDVAAEVSALGLEGHVSLIDRWIADADLAGLIASHHLVVLPYRSATTSGIVPLARASGRPVVATCVGGLAEQVVDGVDGVLCPPGDPSRLAGAITLAWERRERLARQAAERHVPTWASVGERIGEILAASADG